MAREPSPRRPLYLRIAETIRQRYVDGQPAGHRLPTERDLEARLEVSSITIRAALKELESARCIERRHGSGTYVLKQETSRQHVGILLEADISEPRLSPYYLKVLQELRVALFKRGISSRPYLGYLRVDLEIGELTCREFAEELMENRICGVISLFAKRHPSWLAELQKRSIPLIGSRYGSNHWVTIDIPKMVSAMLENFRARGRKQLLILDLKKNYQSNFSTAILQLAPQYGIEAKPLMIPLYSDEEQPGSWRAFRKALCDTERPPDCLFISDDMLFEKAQAVLVDLNIRHLEQPDIVVYTSDAAPLPIHLPLTLCLYSTQVKACKIAETMQKRLAGAEIADVIEIPFSFLPAKVSAGEGASLIA